MSSVDARRDLIRKLELEKKLEKSISKINNELVTGTMQRFADSGLPYDATLLEGDVIDVLGTHYEKTADIFSKQMSESLPSEIAVTASEENLIEQALLAYFAARAIEQARIITDTNQKNIDAAILAAGETRDADDKPLARRDQAREAGVLAARKLKGRVTGIAITETQNAAETSKATEAEVLSGKRPSIVAGSPGDAGVDKEWFTVGDKDVRDSHVAADSQTRDLSKPFTVGGQLLRWPGDTALGATIENVINCRCSSVYDASAVFAIRRKKATAPFTETVASEQLLESIGS
jgi:hypothetical protein